MPIAYENVEFTCEEANITGFHTPCFISARANSKSHVRKKASHI